MWLPRLLHSEASTGFHLARMPVTADLVSFTPSIRGSEYRAISGQQSVAFFLTLQIACTREIRRLSNRLASLTPELSGDTMPHQKTRLVRHRPLQRIVRGVPQRLEMAGAGAKR